MWDGLALRCLDAEVTIVHTAAMPGTDIPQSEMTTSSGSMASAVRTLRVLVAVATATERANPDMSLQDVADAVGLPRATAHRILQLLRESGFIHQNVRTKQYTLGFMASWLGDRAREAFPLKTIAAPIMEEAIEETDETLSLNVLLSDSRVCVHSVHGNSELSVVARPGQLLPLHLGSSGKVLLAFCDRPRQKRLLDQLVANGSIANREQFEKTLEEVRRQGWIGTVSERVRGIAAFSVPVWNYDKSEVVACLALSMAEVRQSDDSERHALDLLTKTAERLRLELKTRPRMEAPNE